MRIRWGLWGVSLFGAGGYAESLVLIVLARSLGILVRLALLAAFRFLVF